MAAAAAAAAAAAGVGPVFKLGPDFRADCAQLAPQARRPQPRAGPRAPAPPAARVFLGHFGVDFLATPAPPVFQADFQAAFLALFNFGPGH